MAQRIDLAEFETLFKAHHKYLCNIAYNLLKDKDAAKDIVQDVFFKFWKNREKIHISEQLLGYLSKATIHTSLNYLRGIKRLIRIDREPEVVSGLKAKSGMEEVTFKELERRVHEAIERLPPKCRVIYQLSRQENHTHQQIADALNLSLKTVENQMGIALEKLRKELKPFLMPEFLLLVAILAYMAVRLFWS
jgi:RNA polymerase sigma-70 factor, ECF subfamily